MTDLARWIPYKACNGKFQMHVEIAFAMSCKCVRLANHAVQAVT